MNATNKTFPIMALLGAISTLLPSCAEYNDIQELESPSGVIHNEATSLEGNSQQLAISPYESTAESGSISDDAVELRALSAQFTDVRGTMPILVPGSVRLEEGETSALMAHDKPIFLSSEEALTLYDSGEFSYSSGLSGKSYDVVVSSTCPGYTRNSADAYAYNANGGYCSFSKWYTQDTHDCRFIVHVGASAFKHGTCAWSVYASEQGVFSYSASNTNSAQQNTTNSFIYLNAGQTLTAGTCGLTGASATGDTYLRLFDGSTLVAQNDDACGGRSSNLVYTATASKKYELRAGCFSSGSCGGTVVWSK